MANERYTESIVLSEMKSKIGKNNFGYVFPQGDISEIDKIQKLLEKAGGKPKDCAIDDYSTRIYNYIFRGYIYNNSC